MAVYSKCCVSAYQRADKKSFQFGHYIRRELKKRNILVETAAEWLGISSIAFYRKVNGAIRWSVTDVMILCYKLKFTNEEIGELLSLGDVS